MLLLKHIVVATDFSTISVTALRHALGIAHRCHSTVSLLHVIDASFYVITTPGGITAAIDNAQRDFEQLIPQLNAEGVLDGLKLDYAVEVGSVWETLAECIDEKHYDLLVLGTHGRAGLAKFVLGSVAESAFREAACPVLTVGPGVARSKSSGVEAKHFLVPTDLSNESTNALGYGISLARATGGDVTLLHVLNPAPERNGNGPDLIAEVKSRLDQVLNQHPGTASMVRCRIEFGLPAQLIVKVAEQEGSDLIVMGLRAWSIEGPPMWRTTYDVLIEAPCPVISMRTPALSTNDAGG